MTFNGPLIYFLIAMWLCPVVAYFVLAKGVPPPPSDRELRTAAKAWRFVCIASPVVMVVASIGAILEGRITPEFVSGFTVGTVGWLIIAMWKNYLGRALSPGGRS